MVDEGIFRKSHGKVVRGYETSIQEMGVADTASAHDAPVLQPLVQTIGNS